MQARTPQVTPSQAKPAAAPVASGMNPRALLQIDTETRAYIESQKRLAPTPEAAARIEAILVKAYEDMLNIANRDAPELVNEAIAEFLAAQKAKTASPAHIPAVGKQPVQAPSLKDQLLAAALRGDLETVKNIESRGLSIGQSLTVPEIKSVSARANEYKQTDPHSYNLIINCYNYILAQAKGARAAVKQAGTSSNSAAPTQSTSMIMSSLGANSSSPKSMDVTSANGNYSKPLPTVPNRSVVAAASQSPMIVPARGVAVPGASK